MTPQERIARLRGWGFASTETQTEFTWLLDVAEAALWMVDFHDYQNKTVNHAPWLTLRERLYGHDGLEREG